MDAIQSTGKCNAMKTEPRQLLKINDTGDKTKQSSHIYSYQLSPYSTYLTLNTILPDALAGSTLNTLNCHLETITLAENVRIHCEKRH